MIEKDLGNLSEARSLWEKAYDIAVRKLGPGHQTTKTIAEWLAVSHSSLGIGWQGEL